MTDAFIRTKTINMNVNDLKFLAIRITDGITLE